MPGKEKTFPYLKKPQTHPLLNKALMLPNNSIMKYDIFTRIQDSIFKEDGARFFLNDKSGPIGVFYGTVTIM